MKDRPATVADVHDLAQSMPHVTRIDGSQGKARGALLALAIVVDLALLGVFKYAGLAVSTINELSGGGLRVPALELPLGISFFTFHCMSYLIDVYRGAFKRDDPQAGVCNEGLELGREEFAL